VVVKEADDRSGENLFQFSRAYDLAHEKLGHPPRSAEEFKPFCKDIGESNVLLTSPNDRQPYVVFWGADMRNAPDPTVIVAHEKTGINGVRYVLTPTGVDRLKDAQFAAAKFASGHQPKAGR
jgi:hypothetical protein